MKEFNPHVSVDCVIFGYDQQSIKVLLNTKEPDLLTPLNKLKLPGNMILRGEQLMDSAQRTLLELTGLKDIYLKQFGVFDDPNRLNDEIDRKWLSQKTNIEIQRVITVSYYSLIPVQKAHQAHNKNKFHSRWVEISDIPELIFDHNKIIEFGLATLRKEIFTDPLAYELLPEKFTLNQLQRLYEVVLGIELDNRNFRKKAQKLPYIIHLNEKQKEVSHKPGYLYRFDKELFLSFIDGYNKFII